MPPLDPSIPLGAQAPQNSLQSLAAPLQTAQSLLSLRSNQMQLQANQAISQAYQQSILPDGSVDFNKLQSLAAQNGAGAFLPQFMGQIAQQRNQQLQYDQGKLDLLLKQQQGIRGMIGSLALDPRTGKEDMTSAIAGQISNAVSSGILPLERGVAEMKEIPFDPTGQASWINQHLMNTLTGEQILQARMPQNVAVPNGGSTVLLNRDPLTGQTTPSTVVQNTLAPEQLAQPMMIVGPNGEQRQITRAQWLSMQRGGGAPANPTLGTSPYTGRLTDGQSNAVGQPLGIQSSLSPAEQSALQAQGTSSNKAAQTLADSAADVPMRVNLLNTARDALNGTLDKDGNPLDTGAGADWRNNAKSFINALAPGVAQKIGWTGDVKNYDEFKKILTNYASSVSGSLGTGTDARLNAAVTGNANPGISSMANADILTKTIAGENMRAAQNYAFQNSGQSTDKFNQWQSQWNRSVDPAMFVYAAMTPDQRSRFATRQGKGFPAFQQNFFNYVRQGLIPMPGAAQGAPQ